MATTNTLNSSWRAPNLLLRTALFAATNSRGYCAEYTTIATTEGVTLAYRGETLTQFDLDVYAALLGCIPFLPGPDPRFSPAKVEFTLSELGRLMGRSADNATEIAKRRAALERLKEGFVCVTFVSKKYSAMPIQVIAPLISLRTPDGPASPYRVGVHEDIAKLFLRGGTTLSTKTRTALAGRPLAAWLHAWILSQQNFVFEYGVDTLLELSGGCSLGALETMPTKTRNAKLKDFKVRLEVALTVLKKEHSVVKSFDFHEKSSGKGLKLEIIRVQNQSLVTTDAAKPPRRPRLPSISKKDAEYLLMYEMAIERGTPLDEESVELYCAIQRKYALRRKMQEDREWESRELAPAPRAQGAPFEDKVIAAVVELVSLHKNALPLVLPDSISAQLLIVNRSMLWEVAEWLQACCFTVECNSDDLSLSIRRMTTEEIKLCSAEAGKQEFKAAKHEELLLFNNPRLCRVREALAGHHTAEGG